MMTRTSFFVVLPLLFACAGGGSDSPGGTGGTGGASGASGAGGEGGEGGGSDQTCVDDEDCNDGNQCTVDTCGAEGRCETSPEPDETGCEDGDGLCVAGVCQPVVALLPCTEEGLREAIELGGGPYGFACDGPQSIDTDAEIVIDNDVILDGLGNLTIDGGGQHRTLSVLQDVTAELRRLGVTGGSAPGGPGGGVWVRPMATLAIFDSSVTNSTAPLSGGGIASFGTLRLVRADVSGNVAGGDGGGVNNTGMLTITDSSISGNRTSLDGGGLRNSGTLTMVGCTISANQAAQHGGGLMNANSLTLVNSTVSGNTAAQGGGGIRNISNVSITHGTLSGNDAISGSEVDNGGRIVIANTLVDGECASFMSPTWISDNYNLESPADTCGFDGPDDLVDRSESDLALGPLQDNGGPTETHALMSDDSDAVDAIPAVVCDTQSDQRGVVRPQGAGCDIGAYELEP